MHHAINKPTGHTHRPASGWHRHGRVACGVAVGMLLALSAMAQQVDLNNIRKNFSGKAVRVGGGVSANTVFYDGNDGQKRQPFTYFLSGNVNVNLFNQVNLPFSFSFTNVGADFGYPTLPNRLSVHPTYKWVTAHIGDIAMSFSPYTLNGHMFRGAGVDLTPKGPFKISAMGGRLVRAVEYDSATTNRIVPAAYERWGYGAKVRYDQASHYLGMTLFAAKDKVSSLAWQPDSLTIFPQGNVAMSWEGGVKIAENLNLSGEYGLSMLTRDVRSPREGSSVFNNAFGTRASTHTYHALRAELSYQLWKNTIGVGYERIDPEYRTLGAYYFNNDYENVTLRYARPFFKDKLSLALSWGVQHDNLNHTNEQSSQRYVSSANLDYTPNNNLAIALSYSSFQTYMNMRSQFTDINNQTPYDNLDTLNFTQLSKNMAANVNYSFGHNENRRNNFNANLSFQEAADKQGDIIRPGALSQFYNLSTAYNVLFVPQAIGLTVAFNTTYNHAGADDFVTLGPTLGAKAKVLQKKITTGFTTSYNVSMNGGEVQNKVLNVRLNAGYVFLRKHNLSANGIWQRRERLNQPNTQSTTVTLAYAYSF